MKKLYISLVLILSALSIFVSYNKKELHRVIKIESPTQIYVDTNNNYIFDEKEPIYIKNIYFIEKQNSSFLSELSNEECLFLHYKAIQTANNLIKNKFIQIKNNELYIDGEKYSDILLKSGFFYTDEKSSKEKIIKQVKVYNLNDYVLFNTKSKRYHKLNCKELANSKNIEIIKKDKLPKDALPCHSCCTEILKVATTEIPTNIAIKKIYKKENIKIIFTDLNETSKPTSQCTNETCKILKEEIDKAQNSIDFAIYGISNQPKIINALINAKKRGVKIRWVCDFDKKDKNYYKDTQTLKQLISTYKTDEQYESNNKSAIMHNKFFIFDNTKVFTGSSNITSTDISGFNANISVLINKKEIANQFSKEFEQLYNGKFHIDKSFFKKDTIKINNQTKIKVLFSPQDKIITTEIIPIIQNANKYIYIPIFFITKKELINALVYAHSKGVDVRIINDATNANTKHSIHKTLRKYGIRVKTENYAGKLHMKAMIVDDNISIIGSMNFSNSGEKRNDENVLIIEDREITQYLKNIFLYLWNKIPAKYELFDPNAESIESIGSCFDGIDNDFDGQIDRNDNGCMIK